MAGESTSVALKPAPADPLTGILDFSKYIGGQKQTVGGTGVSATQGQTAPLEQLIATLSDPNNLAALVGNLFNQGAAQVPGLTSQFANATGTRTSNNTMLSQSLALLNQNILQAISSAVVDQQKTAVQGASNLAATNKTTTTSDNKTQVSKPNDVRTAAGATAASVLTGNLLNHLGKTVLKPATTGKSAGADTTQQAAIDNAAAPLNFDIGTGNGVAAAPSNEGIIQAQQSTGFSGDFSGAGQVDLSGTGFEDTSNLSDATTAASTASDVSNATDTSDSIFNVGDFDFESLFSADGGLVHLVLPRQMLTGMRPAMPTQRNVSGKPAMPGVARMADGGTVPLRRNANYMGEPSGTAGTPVLANPAASNIGPKVGGLDLISQLKQLAPPGTEISDSGAGSGAAGTGSSVAGGESQGAAPAGLGMGLSLGLNGMVAPTPIGPVPLGLIVNLMLELAAQNEDEVGGESNATALGAQNVSNDNLAAEAAAADAAGNGAVGSEGGVAGSPAGGGEGTSGAAAAAGAAAAEGAAAAAGNAGVGPGGESGESGGGNTGGNTGGEGGSTGGGDSGSGSGDDADGGIIRKRNRYGSGGIIRATTKANTRGVDLQPIMATPNEYMLPVDTVNFIGKDLLDELVGLTHIPLRGGV